MSHRNGTSLKFSEAIVTQVSEDFAKYQVKGKNEGENFKCFSERFEFFSLFAS
jgi:hypothetical protein